MLSDKNSISLGQFRLSLSTGEWLIGRILPEYRRAILNGLRSRGSTANENSSNTILSFLYYRDPRISCAQIDQSFIIDACSHSADFWRRALGLIGRDADLAKGDESWGRTIDNSLRLIGETFPNARTTFSAGVAHIVVVSTDRYRSASNPHLLGALILRKTASIGELAMSIVHELAHQELFLINTLDRLVRKDFESTLSFAPFQGKPRPPIGRLHSAHALFRMIQFGKKINAPEVGAHVNLLKATIRTFQENELSKFGWSLVHEIYPMAYEF